MAASPLREIHSARDLMVYVPWPYVLDWRQGPMMNVIWLFTSCMRPDIFSDLDNEVFLITTNWLKRYLIKSKIENKNPSPCSSCDNGNKLVPISLYWMWWSPLHKKPALEGLDQSMNENIIKLSVITYTLAKIDKFIWNGSGVNAKSKSFPLALMFQEEKQFT